MSGLRFQRGGIRSPTFCRFDAAFHTIQGNPEGCEGPAGAADNNQGVFAGHKWALVLRLALKAEERDVPNIPCEILCEMGTRTIKRHFCLFLIIVIFPTFATAYF